MSTKYLCVNFVLIHNSMSLNFYTMVADVQISDIKKFIKFLSHLLETLCIKDFCMQRCKSTLNGVQRLRC